MVIIYTSLCSFLDVDVSTLQESQISPPDRLPMCPCIVALQFNIYFCFLFFTLDFIEMKLLLMNKIQWWNRKS